MKHRHSFFTKSAQVVSISLLLVPALLAVVSCTLKPLSASGTVRLWSPREDADLEKTAETFPDLTLEAPVPEIPWLKAMEKPETVPDMVLLEWGKDFVAGNDSKYFLDLTPYRTRHQAFRAFLPVLTDRNGMPASFLPAAVYVWGLYYNEEVLKSAGIGLPRTFEEFRAALEKLKSAGVVPIALGNTFGWPGLAWVSYLDLRMNGLTEHRKLIEGTRQFTDPSLKPVFDTLEAWRNGGVFNADAGSLNWTDAMDMIVSGKAAFTLIASFAATRTQGNAGILFTGVPSGGRSTDQGEVAVVQGFAVTASGANADSAVNLAATYAAQQAPGQTKDLYRLPAVKMKSTEGLSQVKTAESAILSAAKGVVPQMDRLFPTQIAYKNNQAMISFFAADSSMSGQALSERLGTVRPVTPPAAK